MKAKHKKNQPTLEELERQRVVSKRNGVNIRIRGWTEETGSGSGCHAKSLTEAIRKLRIAAKYHANFSMDVYCEGERPDNTFCCEWFHQRHLAYAARRSKLEAVCLRK